MGTTDGKHRNRSGVRSLLFAISEAPLERQSQTKGAAYASAVCSPFQS